MTKTNLLIVTVALMLLRLITITVLPLIDPTEGRYSVVAQLMVESNDWITPSVWMNGQVIPFLGKPPLQFWLSSISIRALDLNELALRLPAFLSGLLLLYFVYLTLKKTRDKETALAGVAITASTAIFLVVCGAVATDMTFSAMAGVAILSYILFSVETTKLIQKMYSLFVFMFLGLAFMTKGPVSLIMFGGPIFVWVLFTKSWRNLRNHAWLTGSLTFLGLTVPWFIACEKANPGFLKYFFINENFLRFLTPDYGDQYGHGHQYIRGAAIIMMLVGCLPWSLIAIFTLAQKKLSYVRNKLREPAFGIALTGIIFITLFWCLARQLLATYILPVVPLLAVVLAPIIDRRVLKYTLRGCLALATVATVGACLFMANPNSLKNILRAVNAQEAKENRSTKLVFFGKTPYSAYIYSGDSLVSMPFETVDQTLQHSKTADYEHLLIFRKKLFNKLKSYQKNDLVIVYKNDSWVFVRIKKA